MKKKQKNFWDARKELFGVRAFARLLSVSRFKEFSEKKEKKKKVQLNFISPIVIKLVHKIVSHYGDCSVY